MTVLVLTYHAVEPGPPPLFVDPELFTAQLDLLAEAGVRTLTVSELGAQLRAGRLPERAAAITFDDGAASVARTAAPLLVERGLVATVFCVAGHLGGRSDWRTQQTWAPRLELARAEELAELARLGFEIGSHGTEHLPLTRRTPRHLLRRELEDSRRLLGQALGVEISSFAYPYGVQPPDAARLVAEAGYVAACGVRLDVVRIGSDPLALPRVDVHYLRRPQLFRRALRGSLRPYLLVRRTGARARRALRKDYASAAVQ